MTWQNQALWKLEGDHIFLDLATYSDVFLGVYKLHWSKGNLGSKGACQSTLG